MVIKSQRKKKTQDEGKRAVPRRFFFGWVVLLCVVKPQLEDFGLCRTKAGSKM